jgi:serine O-acetyltransferase
MATPRDIPAPAMPGLFACMRADLKLLCREKDTLARRAVGALTNRGFHAISLYRIARMLMLWHIPLAPLILSRLCQGLYAVDISPAAQLGPGIVIVHGFGVVIGTEARIEGDCCIFHGVTLGNRGSEWVGSAIPDGQPYVERSCMFGAGAKILGPLNIGRNCVIGANAVVIRNVPANSIVGGIPAKVLAHRPEMDEHLRPVNGYRKEEPTRIDSVAPSTQKVSP